MRQTGDNSARAGEKGAISIKALFVLVLMAALIYTVIVFVPVYVEQRRVIYDVEEVARVASVRNLPEDKVKAALEKIRQSNELPDGSITLTARATDSCSVQVSYSRNVNLLVTQYVWRVDSKVSGKSL